MSAAASTDPADLGVLEAAGELRARRLSARELLDAVLARIDARNGGEPTFDGAPDAVNAWARVYPEHAAAMARAADERLAREGDEAPLLCGIPIGLKDLYAAEGLPLTASSRMLEGTSRARTASHGRGCGRRAWCSSATPTRTSSRSAARPTRSATRGPSRARRAGRAAGRPPRSRRAWSPPPPAPTPPARCAS